MTAVADVLNGAADLIERDGWCQGTYQDGTGKRCADGAITAAGMSWSSPDRALARELLRSTVGHVLIVDWNDHPDRTQAEVVAALRAAAERAS